MWTKSKLVGSRGRGTGLILVVMEESRCRYMPVAATCAEQVRAGQQRRQKQRQRLWPDLGGDREMLVQRNKSKLVSSKGRGRGRGRGKGRGREWLA